MEVAFVTGSLFFMAQAESVSHAQQHAAQLYATGTATNAAVTADLATVLHMWLMSATSAYVDQMTASLGATAQAVAAVDVLRLGLFSTVAQTDVKVLSASIDWELSATLYTNSSGATQNYAYNVTVQIAVLTSDMLLSVFVDVINSRTSRRRLHSDSDNIAASLNCSSCTVALPFHRTLQTDSSMKARALSSDTAWDHLHQQTRSLLSSSSNASFPLASLLAFKANLVLAAFTGTSGCSVDSLAALFYEPAQAPEDLSDVCVSDDSSGHYSMNSKLLASASASVPLLQVCTLMPAWIVAVTVYMHNSTNVLLLAVQAPNCL